MNIPAIPLSLYVHFPWCIKKCPYCDFNSHAVKNEIPEQIYVDALLRDLEQELVFVQGRKICSVFFGGGTPSLLSGKAIATILSAIDNRIGFENDIEITLEANPGTAEQQRFHDYRSAGVNRLSLGAQSFQNKFLQKLGRIHSAQEILRAVQMLKQSGFENFNLDLMFALPEQTLAEAMADLQQAIDLEPTHISWYQLTIEPNTAFYREPPVLPDDDQQFEIMQVGHNLLSQNAYTQYETSAFSKTNKQCRHNRNYWEFGDYLGIGAGAHGKVSLPEAIYRRQKTRMPEQYMQSVNPCSHHHALDHRDLVSEFPLNALRLIDGVPRQLFTERTGLSFGAIDSLVNQLVKDGLLEAGQSRLAPTPKGALFLNDVVARFIDT